MILLTTTYLAPVEYYQYLNRSSQAVVEQHDHYVKQTYRNRCVIASANGLQTLSIPVIKPLSPKCLTKDIQIADYGNWRHLHWNALLSAYNSTPFFEYYADDLYPFYEKRIKYLFDLNEQLMALIFRLLNISPQVIYSKEYQTELPDDCLDLREKIHPKKPSCLKEFKPYYQVFQERYGFQPNLSIIDLLFNMGPEAVFYL